MSDSPDLADSLLGRWLRRELEARTQQAPANDIEEGRLQAVLTVCRLIGPHALGAEAEARVAALLSPERERAIFFRWHSAVLAAAEQQSHLDDLALGYLHATLGIAIAGERAEDPPADTALVTRWMENPRLRALDDRFDMEARKLLPEPKA